jgi:hypothetical protein
MPTRTALALALPVLFCGCLSLLEDQDRELVVVNNTASAIIVDVDVKSGSWYDGDEDEDHEVVYPGGIFSEDYPGAGEVEIRVIRVSDGALLFAAEYDADDFEDEDGEIVITVNP